MAATALQQRHRPGGCGRRSPLARNVRPPRHVQRAHRRRLRADPLDSSPAGARRALRAAVRAQPSSRGRVAAGPRAGVRAHAATGSARSGPLQRWRRPRRRPRQRSHDHLWAVPVAVADLGAVGRDDRGRRSGRVRARTARRRVRGAPGGASPAVSNEFLTTASSGGFPYHRGPMKRRTRRIMVVRGTASYGSGSPPSGPDARVEWQLLRLTADGWIASGSAHGPSWMPDAIAGAAIWISWVVLRQPRIARGAPGHSVADRQ